MFSFDGVSVVFVRSFFVYCIFVVAVCLALDYAQPRIRLFIRFLLRFYSLSGMMCRTSFTPRREGLFLVSSSLFVVVVCCSLLLCL